MSTKQILIAEDDKFLASAYQLKFTNAGYQVKLASNGQEALEILKEFTPQVIITDLMMPIMDGYELLKELKSSPKTKTIPVLVTSNLSQPEDKDRCLEVGAQGFLVKSDSPISTILDQVDKLIKT